MTEEEFNKRMDQIEARGKRIMKLVVTLALAAAASFASLWVAYREVHDRIVSTNFHLAVTDKRVDETPGAPPPDPKAVIVERQIEEIRGE